MSGAFKKIAFVAPRPDMSKGEFRTYWRERHGPLLAGLPEYREYRLRYVQNHAIESGPIGEPFPFGGTAEFWLPGD